jgi:UrcA family protein
MFAHSNAPALPARTLIVSFADLNVGEEPGAKALIGRIKAAAQKVCGPRPSSPLLNREMISYKTCVRDAMERGIASANQPLVVQLYHSGGHGMTGSTTTTKK